MKRDASVFLKHILESTGIIEKYVKGHSEQDFLGSMALQMQDHLENSNSGSPEASLRY
jgi:uncharacterized protein with HEPN domain